MAARPQPFTLPEFYLPYPVLDLVAGWHTWGFYCDDLFAEAYKRRRDLPGARAVADRLASFLSPGTAAVPATPAERALVDLWSRTAPSLPPRARWRFPGQIRAFLGSWLWELVNLVQSRVPDPVDYIEMRRHPSASEFSLTLAHELMGEGLPGRVRAAPALRALEDAFSDIGPLRNDIVSYQKEMTHEGEICNAVVVVQLATGRYHDRRTETGQCVRRPTRRLIETVPGIGGPLVAMGGERR